MSLYQRACDGGEQSACHNLGVMLLDGIAGVRPDPERGLAILKKACAAGVANSCDVIERHRK
jgi:TPR repeat protein